MKGERERGEDETREDLRSLSDGAKKDILLRRRREEHRWGRKERTRGEMRKLLDEGRDILLKRRE